MKKEKIISYTEVLPALILGLWAVDNDWKDSSFLDYSILFLMALNVVMVIIKAILITRKNKLIDEGEKYDRN